MIGGKGANPEIISAFVEMFRACFVDNLNLQIEKAAAQGHPNPHGYNTPANIPLVANIFNEEYLPKKMSMLPEKTAINLT